MLKKYAVQLLQDVSGELEINSYCCKNADDKKLLDSVRSKVDKVIEMLENPEESK